MISRPRGGMRVAFWSFLCPAPDLVSSLQYTQNFESKKLWVFSADRNSHALAVGREGTCRASCHPTTFALLAPEPLGVSWPESFARVERRASCSKPGGNGP